MKIMSQYNFFLIIFKVGFLQNIISSFDLQAKYEFPTQEDREVELKLFSSFTVLFLMAN